MLNFWKNWLLNSSIKKKFFPSLVILLMLVLFFAIISTYSIYKVDKQSHKIYTENFTNLEMLNNLVQKMYVCRVLGRDILFEPNTATRSDMYIKYIIAFDNLDQAMINYSKRISGKKLDEFNLIIEKKDKYKESMILSAQIHMKGGNFDDALEALQVVTPIAQTFFSKIEDYITEEEALMQQVLTENEESSKQVFQFVLSTSIFVFLAIFLVVNYGVNVFYKHLNELSASIQKISDTGNMNMNIPSKFFTKDELGQIVTVVDKLKNMLQDLSFKDKLTNGYNATAYYSELYNYFENVANAHTYKKFTLVIFDMNNLKTINDSLGHISGDKAIFTAHSILLDSFSKYGKIFRVGGDEFVSILQTTDSQSVENAIKNMNEEIAKANKVNSFKFGIACAYGIFEGRSRIQFNDFYEQIDKKMYENKASIKQNHEDDISIKEKEARIISRID